MRWINGLLILSAIAFALLIASAHAYLGPPPPPAFEAKWSIKTSVTLLEYGCAFGASFSPDGSLLAYASPKKAYIVYTASGERRPLYSVGGYVGIHYAVFSPSGTRVAVGLSLGGVVVLDTITGKKICTTTNIRGTVTGLAYTRQGILLAAADGKIHAYSPDSCRELWSVKRPHPVGAITGGSRLLAVIGCKTLTCSTGAPDSYFITVYNAATGERLWGKKLGEPIRDAVFSPSDRVLYIATGRGTILALEAATGTKIAETSLRAPIVDAEIAGDERLAVLLENGTVLHLDPRSLRPVWRGDPPPPGLRICTRGGLLSPTGRSYVYTAELGRGLTYMAPMEYGRLVVEAGEWAKIAIQGPGGSFTFTHRGKPVLLYATPGTYEVRYQYTRLPYTRLIFNMSNNPVGTLEARVAAGKETVVKIPTPLDFYAVLTLVAPSTGDKYYSIRLEASNGKGGELVLRRGEKRTYLIDPMTYTVTLPDGSKKTFRARPGQRIVIEIPSSEKTEPATKTTAPKPRQEVKTEPKTTTSMRTETTVSPTTSRASTTTPQTEPIESIERATTANTQTVLVAGLGLLAFAAAAVVITARR